MKNIENKQEKNNENYIEFIFSLLRSFDLDEDRLSFLDEQKDTITLTIGEMDKRQAYIFLSNKTEEIKFLYFIIPHLYKVSDDNRKKIESIIAKVNVSFIQGSFFIHDDIVGFRIATPLVNSRDLSVEEIRIYITYLKTAVDEFTKYFRDDFNE